MTKQKRSDEDQAWRYTRYLGKGSVWLKFNFSLWYQCIVKLKGEENWSHYILMLRILQSRRQCLKRCIPSAGLLSCFKPLSSPFLSFVSVQLNSLLTESRFIFQSTKVEGYLVTAFVRLETNGKLILSIPHIYPLGTFFVLLWKSERPKIMVQCLKLRN